MKIGIGSKHFLQEYMDDWTPERGDPLSYGAELFPNTMAANERLRLELKDYGDTTNGTDEFMVTIFFRYSEVRPPREKKRPNRKTKYGYSGAIDVYRDDISRSGVERDTSEILDFLKSSLSELCERLPEPHSFKPFK